MAQRKGAVAVEESAEDMADRLFDADEKSSETNTSAWDEVIGENGTAPEAFQDWEIDLTRDSHEPLPVGNHRVKAQFRGISSQPGPSGYHYIIMRFEGLEEPNIGLEARDNLSLSPRAAFKLESFLDAIGVPSQGKMMASQFEGKVLWIAVDREEYQDRVQAKVAAYLPPTTGGDFSGSTALGEELR